MGLCFSYASVSPHAWQRFAGRPHRDPTSLAATFSPMAFTVLSVVREFWPRRGVTHAAPGFRSIGAKAERLSPARTRGFFYRSLGSSLCPQPSHSAPNSLAISASVSPGSCPLTLRDPCAVLVWDPPAPVCPGWEAVSQLPGAVTGLLSLVPLLLRIPALWGPSPGL